MRPPIRFVYCPRSGDRVFCENPGSEVLIVQHGNGCRHVIGGAHLSVETTRANHWWYDHANRLIRKLIRLAGQGIGWNDEVAHIILPIRYAWAAVEVLNSAAALHGSPPVPKKDIVGLVEVGAARLIGLEYDGEMGDKGVVVVSENQLAAAREFIPDSKDFSIEWFLADSGIRVSMAPIPLWESVEIVSWPEDWGRPTISGGKEADPDEPAVPEEE